MGRGCIGCLHLKKLECDMEGIILKNYTQLSHYKIVPKSCKPKILLKSTLDMNSMETAGSLLGVRIRF